MRSVADGRNGVVPNAGGPGRPVVDALRREGLNPVPVSITAGRRTRQVNGMVYVPKRELVRGLVAPIETGRLKTAKSLPLAEALVGELQAFRVQLTAKGRDSYAAHSGEHDDLLLAVTLAVWAAQESSGFAKPVEGLLG